VEAVAAFVVLVLVCGALLAGTAALTGERIEQNRQRQFLALVAELTGGERPADAIRWQGDVAPLCDGTALLRGRAAGYGGAIHWLAAVNVDATPPVLTGLRITAHQETPGIADFLNRPERGWLASLGGRSATALAATDAVTGATITSRALVRSLAEAVGDPAVAAVACEP
jgi:electron transport complex protein RnfG